MKSLYMTFPALLSAGWAKLTGAPAPAGEPTPKAAQVIADQEWEEEGGSIKPAKQKPGAEPETKIPF